jgi:hypothetical protein
LKRIRRLIYWKKWYNLRKERLMTKMTGQASGVCDFSASELESIPELHGKQELTAMRVLPRRNGFELRMMTKIRQKLQLLEKRLGKFVVKGTGQPPPRLSTWIYHQKTSHH